jgi:hypothetical protein
MAGAAGLSAESQAILSWGGGGGGAERAGTDGRQGPQLSRSRREGPSSTKTEREERKKKRTSPGSALRRGAREAIGQVVAVCYIGREKLYILEYLYVYLGAAARDAAHT